MKASDLELEELVQFGDGRIDLQGRRLVLHSINAFAQLRRDLLEMVGLERMRRILTRFGYFWGQADAAAMKRVFEWDNVTEWLKAGPRLHTLQGVARSVIKSLSLDETTGRFRMDLIWHDSGEAEEQLLELGKTDYAICRMLTGYASGYSSFCVGKDVYFIEQKCRAKGDRVCSAIGMDRDSWG
ncbi:MAG TPA: XylR N-terminal domain-containing protein, partial [bacterium]|nr:XylR N-terminal domain-containing protein [bacterium]